MELDAFCPFPWTRARITSEGKLAMCCFMRADTDRPDREAYLGNILDQNFDAIWFGDIAQEIRQSVLDGKLHDRCDCSGCPHRKERQSQRFVHNEYPIHLEIDLPNTHCNVDSPACIMCERAEPNFKAETSRLTEVLCGIGHLMPNLEQIHLQGNAEPFFNGLIFDVLEQLNFSEFKHRITVSTVTNGMFMTEDVRERWFSTVPHSVTVFSLDAATPETYQRIRIFDAYDSVVDNIALFDVNRVSARQFLQIFNNINTLNVHEVVMMCETARQLGVDLIEFAPTDGFNKAILVNKANCGLFAKAQGDIVEFCSKKKIPFKISRPLDMGLTQELALRTL